MAWPAAKWEARAGAAEGFKAGRPTVADNMIAFAEEGM